MLVLLSRIRYNKGIKKIAYDSSDAPTSERLITCESTTEWNHKLYGK